MDIIHQTMEGYIYNNDTYIQTNDSFDFCICIVDMQTEKLIDRIYIVKQKIDDTKTIPNRDIIVLDPDISKVLRINKTSNNIFGARVSDNCSVCWLGTKFWECRQAGYIKMNHDKFIDYLKLNGLYKNEWPYNHNYAFIKTIIATSEMRLMVLGYFQCLNLLFVRDNIISKLGKNDYLLITDWGVITHSITFMLKSAKHPLNIFWLANGIKEVNFLKEHGIQSYLVSHNCFISDKTFYYKPCKKIYDYIFLGSLHIRKRPELAKLCKNIIYVCDGKASDDYQIKLGITNVKFNVSPDELCTMINQSRTALCLSEEEGGCYSSSEALLCGVPIITTPCKGGREVYYTSENSVVCNTPEEIASVQIPTTHPEQIRDHSIQLNRQMHHTLLFEILEPIFSKYVSTKHLTGDELLNWFYDLLEEGKSSKGRTVFSTRRFDYLQHINAHLSLL